MKRSLPSADEAAKILAARRTRPVRRQAPPAGRALNKFIKALDDRFGQGPEALQARWREIVGETLARRTEPVKLTKPRGGGGGALEIRVDGPAAALIQHQAPEIVARVNMFLGAGAVTKLRIVQGPVRPSGTGETPGAAARSRRKAPPLDAAAEARLQASVEGAQDGRLKAALLKWGREVMRRER